MALAGLHHITAIAADAPRDVDPHARVLGLRLVKKTVNFDQPDVYPLYDGDERGTSGSILTFFDFPRAGRGTHGAGMPYRVLWRVRHADVLDFWSARLEGELERFRIVVTDAGARPTPVIDRQYFHSVYFREPSGVLCELATRDIGFAVDEPAARLDDELKLPARYESRREQRARALTPIPSPRAAA